MTFWAAWILALAVTVLAHEAGHATVAQALGLPWKPTLTRHGPGVRIGSDRIVLTRPEIVATALGGPAANLLLVLVGYELGWPLLMLFGLDFALFNLLPFKRSDGSRIFGLAA